MKILDVEFLKDRFDYDPETGKLFWKEINQINTNLRRSQFAGKEAGYEYQGYIYVRIGKSNYLSHRICYAIYNEEFPKGIIDHIDGNKKNNKIENLRVCTPAENAKNAKRYLTNKSGITGVRWDKKDNAWRVQIGSNDGKVQKSFHDFFEACCFRKSMELKLEYSLNHGTDREGK